MRKINRDKRIYLEEIRDFLPERIFDSHIHIWRKTDFKKPPGKKELLAPGGSFKEFTFTMLSRTYKNLFPEKKWEGLVFSIPFEIIDFDRVNTYISDVCAKNENCYPLMIPNLEWDMDEIERRMDEGKFLGFKPYYTFVKGKKPAEIRISDYVTNAQLEVANEKGLIILLHIPRPGRIADAYNRRDIVELCNSYPRAKFILAHIGRSYGPQFLAEGIRDIRGLENLYYDIAMVNDTSVIQLLLENVPVSRVLFGTDLPIALMKGLHTCINGRCVFLMNEKLSWSVKTTGIEYTYFAYEIMRAIKQAVYMLKLNKKETRAIFYDNAKNLVNNVIECSGAIHCT